MLRILVQLLLLWLVSLQLLVLHAVVLLLLLKMAMRLGLAVAATAPTWQVGCKREAIRVLQRELVLGGLAGWFGAQGATSERRMAMMVPTLKDAMANAWLGVHPEAKGREGQPLPQGVDARLAGWTEPPGGQRTWRQEELSELLCQAMRHQRYRRPLRRQIEGVR